MPASYTMDDELKARLDKLIEVQAMLASSIAQLAEAISAIYAPDDADEENQFGSLDD